MSQEHPVRTLVIEVLSSPRMSQVCSLLAIGIGFFAETVQRTIGWAGLSGALAVIVLLCAGTLIARSSELAWAGVLPLSLLIFLGWAGVSVLWSDYRWSTVGGLAYLFAFTVLGISVALTRDTIQIVRSFGDVLRLVLGISLAIEILSGVLIDMPIRFLGVDGNLGQLGPIQGVMGSRNQLGLVAVIALITFGLELATHSVSRALAAGSLTMAGLCILLSRSPVVIGLLAALALAAAALLLIRHVSAERRSLWQWLTLLAAFLVLVFAWFFRSGIISALSASNELSYRLAVWRTLWNLIDVHPLQGWGWIGQWRPDITPFSFFASAGAREPTSAVNAYLDVWFQLGLVGLFLFLVLLGLAFTRSWLLAGRRRSIVFAWPALMLVVLLVSSLGESSVLIDYGWMAFVVCCVKAARELSWRRAFSVPQH